MNNQFVKCKCTSVKNYVHFFAEQYSFLLKNMDFCYTPIENEVLDKTSSYYVITYFA